MLRLSGLATNNCKFPDAQGDGTPSEDGSTDMGTFGTNPLIGYSKYCLGYNPLCKCAESDKNFNSSCCEPNAAEGEVGAQAFEGDVPQVPAK